MINKLIFNVFFQPFLTFNHHTLNRLILIFTSIHLSLPSISTIKRTSSKRINKLRDNTTDRSHINTIFFIHHHLPHKKHGYPIRTKRSKDWIVQWEGDHAIRDGVQQVEQEAKDDSGHILNRLCHTV